MIARERFLSASRHGAASLLGVLLTAAALPAATQRVPDSAGGYDTSLFQELSWRNIGPDRGGRSLTVAGTAARPLEYWFGATGGGVWKTTDGGLTWRNASDGWIASSSVGAVAVCEADPDVAYVGMGETQLRGNIMQGDGVYRTRDAGRTWTHLGLAETQAIARIRIHPHDCDVAFLAALGHPYGSNPERGIYRTKDGGASWERVLYRDERTGGVDLSIDPTNPDVLYAALWQVHRRPWGLYSGGPGSGLFKTTDGGKTWTEITRNPGMPREMIAKIGVSVSPADPRTVYAIVEADDGGVFRSDDGGRTWRLTTDDFDLWERGYYYTRILADPIDRETVYIMNIDFSRSTDGGRDFTTIRTPHGDYHDLWVAPDGNRRMIVASDGGAAVTTTAGASWTEHDFPTAQLYHVATTVDRPYHVCGAQQDNTTVCVSSEGRASSGSIRLPPVMYGVGGGEAGYIAPHTVDPDIFYAGHYDGYLTYYDRSTRRIRNIQVWPEKTMGHAASEITERFQWTSPVVLSPLDPEVLYTASQHLWRTTNRGQSWDPISPDLTRHDSATLAAAPAAIRQDRTGADTYATIFTVAPAPDDANTIWTGSDDGLVHVTRDGGTTWTDVTPKGLPEFTRVGIISVSAHRPGTAYLAANRYQMDDRGIYLYRTHDYGQSWTKITNGIPHGHFARAIREDPVRPGLLYAGTEQGVHVSFDYGGHWQPLQLDLPITQVPDLVVEGRDLVVATHGRSFWILDDLAPLRQLTPEVAAAELHLFQPEHPTRGLEPRLVIDYVLGRAAANVTIEVLDAAGSLVRRFGSVRREPRPGTEAERDTAQVGTAPGHHRFVWDLHYPGHEPFRGMITWFVPREGPVAPPGAYTLRLSADGRTVSRSFEIRTDPRFDDITVADLEARFRLALCIRDRLNDVTRAIREIRELRERVEKRAGEASDMAAHERVATLVGQFDALEGQLWQDQVRNREDFKNRPLRLLSKIGYLITVIEGAEARPTEQTYRVFELLSQQLDERLARLADLRRAVAAEVGGPQRAPAARRTTEARASR